MKKIAIAIGHGPFQDPGAVSRDKQTTELAWNTQLALMIKEAISHRAEVFIVKRVIERVPQAAQVNQTNADIAVDLHLNDSETNTASGTEMLYWPTAKEGKRLAEALQEAAVNVLNLPDRGVKPRTDLSFLMKTKMPAVIIESFFIDNDKDLQRGNSFKHQLASAYAEALVKFVS